MTEGVGANGVGDRGSSPMALNLARALIPLGRNVLPFLPERPSQFVMGGAMGRLPQLWGLVDQGQRVRNARRAFEQALPDEDTDVLYARWVRAKGRGIATSLIYLSRWIKGRGSRLIGPADELELPTGPCVVAFLHYSIDPLVQLACIAAARDDLSVRWPMYPIQPGEEDDRKLWLGGDEVPPQIAEMLLPITDPRWMATAVSHLEARGTVFIAIDAPFDSNRAARSSIPIGRARLPLAPSIELFSGVEGVQLLFASPQPKSRSTWVFDVRRAADVEGLARLAGEWIESHPLHWSGWPFLFWRENATVMRENARAIRAPGALR